MYYAVLTNKLASGQLSKGDEFHENQVNHIDNKDCKQLKQSYTALRKYADGMINQAFYFNYNAILLEFKDSKCIWSSSQL